MQSLYQELKSSGINCSNLSELLGYRCIQSFRYDLECLSSRLSKSDIEVIRALCATYRLTSDNAFKFIAEWLQKRKRSTRKPCGRKKKNQSG